MPITPNLIERAVFRLNLAPALMLDFLGAESFQALVAAHRLGVFEALDGGALTAVQTASRIEADERGTTLLLEALEALGYVHKKKDGRYASSTTSAKWLPLLGDGIGWFGLMVERLHDLDECVRRGGPTTDAREWLEQIPDGWREFQAGMVALARMTADEIVAKVRLPATARRLLDVGGGHGLYSIKFCRRYPQLSATVFDLPEAMEVARESVAAEDMGHCVSVRAGDFWMDDLGNGYDVALLFNIIHANLPDKNMELLGKVASALSPGGLVVILDQLAGQVFGGTARAVAALMSLNLFNLAGGQAYRFEEVIGWLSSAGFAKPRRIGLRKAPGMSLILGTKAGSGPPA
ncbi:MAG: hypothetical protein A2148_07065 [Chloroflexi bacterium RBG_16_68_14]|nr:MAG: hypothetical protein A2148_07065 [Chloroflexi bacterium RBG_16_68_14]